jgi:hypothetical protein
MLGEQPGQPAPGPAAYSEFERARGELRSALIQAIARRVGKSLEPTSISEACSDTPLADLCQRKLRTNGFAKVVERLFRWWR